VENQVACCSPAMGSNGGLPILQDASSPLDARLHERLAELLRRYDINDFAASVRVYAVKPM
jgi:arsenite methyltransferase